jgi:hypothetical protein
MIYLAFFLLGILFARYILPAFDGYVDIFQMWAERKKSDIAIGIADDNRIINEINSECNQNDTNAIGFKIPPNASDLPDEDDDDCDNHNKNKPIGFNK